VKARVAIVGGSGYVGGELLRLLLFHPSVEVAQITSNSHPGEYAHSMHSNLRGVTDLRFSPSDDLAACDVLFLALPHGESSASIERYTGMAETVVDCSADFRLRDPAVYEHWYGHPHPAPETLSRFVYGLPERHRTDLASAHYASGVGCNATVLNLAIGPLADAGCLEQVVAETKVGSSEAGSAPSAGSHHPERSSAVRVYSPAGHRHLAEVEQELGDIPIHLTLTAIQMVRGVHLTAHCFLKTDSGLHDERTVWDLYRDAFAGEPFVRLVASKRGLHRFPEPAILAGTNYCDIGFSLDPATGVLIVIAALDNLMKGAAGSAVQSMNIMLGIDERSGLSFPGLHPV
jgi:N-acetyl-gamma-glutamyl-phosphate/LysW-gamma-L-alpha-aminoadipyl-6-phosphate reductase